jgi:hypothetical protein
VLHTTLKKNLTEAQDFFSCQRKKSIRRGKEGYIKMFRGSFIELNWSAKALTDLRELRSSFRTSMRAVGFFSMMVFLASDAASVFLAATMTWAPLRAKTLDVSRPMPLAPPEKHQTLYISIKLGHISIKIFDI